MRRAGPCVIVVPTATSQEDVMTEHPNVATIDRMTKAIFEQDHAALTSILTDDFVFHFRAAGSELSGDRRGLGGLLEVFGWIFEQTNGDIKLDQKYCIASGDWAAEAERAVLGRNGKTLESDNLFSYRFDNGRIAEWWFYVGARAEEAEAFFG
jgi:ketosteroid isomerase-like protein